MKAGQQLLHYRLTEKIGEGGMGIVWAAVDTSLDRPAAIKLLPEALANDAERLTRLEREAKLLATLNHPGIAAVYGLHEARVEDGDHGVRFIAMEKVDGPDLHERLQQGPLSVDQAIDIGQQIADAVATAHQSGVLHRDLKPPNIKLTSEGKVKVLDFGLAKAVGVGGSSSSASVVSASVSPTVTSAGTVDGAILGTVSYMSPEQARGRVLDRRTDVWAFGCVMYELLTGRPAFGGETVSDTLANVIRGEPDWTLLPAHCPPGLVRLLRRCLRKDADRRLHDLADARVLLEDAREEMEAGLGADVMTAAPAVASRTRVLVGAGITLVVGTLLGLWLAGFWAPSSSPARPAHLSLLSPENAPYVAGRYTRVLAISPSGDRIFYLASVPDRPPQIAVRTLGGPEAQLLAGTENIGGFSVSPDGSRVRFAAQRRVKQVPASGGKVLELGAGTDAGVWGDDGFVYHGGWNIGLSRVAEAGGQREPLTELDLESGDLAHWDVEPIPGGRYVLYNRWRKNLDDAAVMRIDLRSGESDVLIDGACFPKHAASGHLLFTRGGAVMAIRFDTANAEPIGEPVVVLDDVFIDSTNCDTVYDVADDGTLVYVKESNAGNQSILTSVDMNGNVTPLDRQHRDYGAVAVSPDGAHLALQVREGIDRDIWLFDYERGGLRRFTFDGTNASPIWTADGSRITFRSLQRGPFDLYWKPLDESEAASLVFASPKDKRPNSWSTDGRKLLYQRTDEVPIFSENLFVYSEDDEAEELTATEAGEQTARWSPDGSLVAYESDASGRAEVYVVAYPLGGGRWQVSLDGGTNPRWAPDGRTLYFVNDDALWAAGIETGSGFQAKRPRRLFGRDEIGGTMVEYDVHPDGEHFVVLRTERDASTPMEVVINWFTELERLVPTGK